MNACMLTSVKVYFTKFKNKSHDRTFCSTTNILLYMRRVDCNTQVYSYLIFEQSLFKNIYFFLGEHKLRRDRESDRESKAGSGMTAASLT